MRMARIAPINLGFFNVKGPEGMIFRSLITETTISNMRFSADTLCVDGKSYIVGGGKESVDFNKQKTINNKILVLNALARLTADKQDFNLVVSTPPQNYTSQSKVLPGYFMGDSNGEYTVIHNDIEKIIKICDVQVFPETLTAYIANNNNGKYDDETVVVIDIGGKTTNTIRVKDGNFDEDEDIITFDNGMYNIDLSIAALLKNNHGKSVDYKEINSGRKHGIFDDYNQDLNLMEVENENIQQIYNNHINEIFRMCKLRNWDLPSYQILVTGGGGGILFDNIKAQYKRAELSQNPLFDNQRGLEIIAGWLYKK